MTALGTAIAVIGLVVVLEEGLVAVVRVGKALGAELGFLKKSKKVNVHLNCYNKDLINALWVHRRVRNRPG
jgi:hypothetical protein